MNQDYINPTIGRLLKKDLMQAVKSSESLFSIGKRCYKALANFEEHYSGQNVSKEATLPEFIIPIKKK